MRARLLLPLLFLPLLFLGVSGCGLAAQDRPVLVDFWPSSEATVPGPLRFIRATYNEPVTVLNAFDARVYAGPVLLPTRVVVDESDPNSLLFLPLGSPTFPADAVYGVNLIQGLAINSQGHYADVAYGWAFDVEPAPPVPVTQPGMVSLFDIDARTTDGGTPTPGAREPIAALRTQNAGIQRVWTQLQDGGGIGEALAWYAPGDATMTPVSLSTSGGDLRADVPALRVDNDLRFLYAAFRDEGVQSVRLAKVDVLTGVEAGSLLLTSIPSSAGTAPAGMTWSPLTNTLYVCAADGATGTVASVDLDTFSEEDLDEALPGVQGITLDAGAGPIVWSTNFLGISSGAANDVTYVVLSTKEATTSTTSTVVGTATGMLATPDTSLALQTLGGFSSGLALVRRSAAAGYTDPVGLEISDDLGSGSVGATDAFALQNIAGTSSFLVLLDAPGRLLLTIWDQSGSTFVQQDLDEGVDGIQAQDVSAVIPGATSIGLVYAYTEP